MFSSYVHTQESIHNLHTSLLLRRLLLLFLFCIYKIVKIFLSGLFCYFHKNILFFYIGHEQSVSQLLVHTRTDTNQLI